MTERPFPIDPEALRAALDADRREVEATAMTDSAKKTYLLHAEHFVRWTEGGFHPCERTRDATARAADATGVARARAEVAADATGVTSDATGVALGRAQAVAVASPRDSDATARGGVVSGASRIATETASEP